MRAADSSNRGSSDLQKNQSKMTNHIPMKSLSIDMLNYSSAITVTLVTTTHLVPIIYVCYFCKIFGTSDQ